MHLGGSRRQREKNVSRATRLFRDLIRDKHGMETAERVVPAALTVAGLVAVTMTLVTKMTGEARNWRWQPIDGTYKR
jgi:hypothetical protein